MNLDNIVEAFVSTIIIVVLFVVAVTIWNPDIGMRFIDILPVFVELLVLVLVGAIIGALIFKLVNQF